MGPARRSRVRFVSYPRITGPSAAPADGVKAVRRRMRHLAPWNVKPLPAMHSASGAAGEPMSATAHERSRRLAMRVLAVQLWHTTATGAWR